VNATPNPIAANARGVLARVVAACRRAGRDPAGVTIVAAAKTVPAERVRVAVAAGIRVVGENRVQEAEAKIPLVDGVEWHFIGRLQRNKARRAVGLFELIHSLDGEALADALDRLGAERGRPVRALVEVNLGGEASKGGIEPGQLGPFLDRLAGRAGLRIEGLMTVPPPADTAEGSRRYFAELRALAERHRLPQLSMGMSDDFEVAVEEGATLVRVGTAIFGARVPPPGP